jgi:K+-sensing histidine kinase KdpD
LGRALKPIIGVVACTFTAAFSSLLLGGKGEIRIAALVMGFLVAISTAMLVGRVTAMLGTISAAIVFYFLLFPPIGGVTLEEPAPALISLFVFLLLSASVVSIAKLEAAEPYRLRTKRGR